MIKAKKSLGQNFLTDHQIATRIVDSVAPLASDIVIEIGSGTGALTRLLVERSAFVAAIEIDAHLVQVLQSSLRAGNLSIVAADVLNVDLVGIIAGAIGQLVASPDPERRRVRIVANLPYYISSPIIERLLSLGRHLFDMTLMLQKEVAERITSGPGSRDYGYLSVMVQYYCEATKLFDVPPWAFTPAPKVHSAVINLMIRQSAPVKVENEARFFALVKAAFAQRRKTILNNLKAAKALGFVAPLESALQAAFVDPRRRAETLSLAEFGSLFNALYRE